MGISGSNFVHDGEEQVSLFGTENANKNEKLDEAIDALRARFGQKAIKFASSEEHYTKYAEKGNEDN